MFFKRSKKEPSREEAGIDIIEPQTIERTELKPGTSLKQDPEVQQMLARMEEINNDLEEKMNHIYEISGISPQKLANYLNDPTQFSASDWEKMISEKEKFQDDFWGEDAPRMKRAAKKAEQKKLTRGRKKKVTASRKKWMKL